MNEITQAVTILQQGGLVAFPTETVYGLGADAKNPEAVRKVFTAKGRPFDHPLIVHLANVDQLGEWARDITLMAKQLAQAFWPGPLTLILKKQPHVLDAVTAGQDTVGIRIPSHPLALALLSEFGSGVVAPSANQFTRVSPTEVSAVQEEMGERAAMILDGGVCAVGLESTIVNVSGALPVILRPGMITKEMIEEVLGREVQVATREVSEVRAPGQHHLHYAPRTKTILLSASELTAYVASVASQERIALMLQSDLNIPAHDHVHVVKMPEEPAAYAQSLYHTLRCLDREELAMIVIEAVPNDPAWEAIRDRLSKASAGA